MRHFIDLLRGSGPVDEWPLENAAKLLLVLIAFGFYIYGVSHANRAGLSMELTALSQTDRRALEILVPSGTGAGDEAGSRIERP